MRIFFERDQKEQEIEFKGRLKDLLKKLNINSETVVVLKNDQIITEDENIRDEDMIKILSVVSGG